MIHCCVIMKNEHLIARRLQFIFHQPVRRFIGRFQSVPIGILEPFQCNFRAIESFSQILLQWVGNLSFNFQFQSNFRAIESFSQMLLQWVGNLSFNFQFQSNFRAISERFQCDCFLVLCFIGFQSNFSAISGRLSRFLRYCYNKREIFRSISNFRAISERFQCNFRAIAFFSFFVPFDFLFQSNSSAVPGRSSRSLPTNQFQKWLSNLIH